MSYKFRYKGNDIFVPTTQEFNNHNHSWNDITNKPASYTPSSHSHSFDSLTEKPMTYTPSSHQHNYATWLGSQYSAIGWLGFYNNYEGTRKGWMGHDGTNSFNLVNETGAGIGNKVGGRYLWADYSSSFKSFRPETASSGLFSLGSPTCKWNTLYATTGSINTSDRNKKNSISIPDEKYEQLADRINIVTFRLNDTDQSDGIGRIHMGIISQDVEKAMHELNFIPKDFAGFCKDKKYDVELDKNGYEISLKERENEFEYSLRYDEVAMLKIWSLEQKNKRMQEDIEELKQKINQLIKLY